MLKETRMDTASPTGVEGLSLRGNKGCERTLIFWKDQERLRF